LLKPINILSALDVTGGIMAKFEDAINRTITSCIQSENEFSYHFADVSKMIAIGTILTDLS